MCMNVLVNLDHVQKTGYKYEMIKAWNQHPDYIQVDGVYMYLEFVFLILVCFTQIGRTELGRSKMVNNK